MAGNPPSRPDKPRGQSREDRLKSALKANLARRKAQARARSDEAGNKKDKEQE
ncbi:hypothetical protein [Sedimentitalea sp.]|uniref:hypothetical protein n=1 Tax=Sedimentitalea sp. TaxID=2048915 RepID=UPI003297B899